MRIIAFISSFLLALNILGQNVMHLIYFNGHLCAQTTTINNRIINVLVDTGSRKSLVFSDVLICKTRNPQTFVGVGALYVYSEYDGLLVTRDFCVRAAYVGQSKKYDAILGLDWMHQHKAKIDIYNMILEYE